MPYLYPDNFFDEELEITAEDLEEQRRIGYKGSVYFDDRTGDLLRNGKNQIIPSSGTDAWHHWCIKCLQTPRYACLAYPSDYGVEIEPAFRASTREEAESILTRTITEALEADPYERLQYIQSIEYNWIAPDSVDVMLSLVGIDDATIDITVRINN